MGRFTHLLGELESGNGAVKTAPKGTSKALPALGPESLIDIVETPSEAVKIEPAKPTKPAAKSETELFLDTKIKLHGRLIDEIDLTALDGLDTSALKARVFDIVKELAREEKLKMNAAELKTLSDGIYDEMTGLGPLEPLLQDDTVSDILINTHEQVYVERRGELEVTAVRFASEEHLLRIVNRIVAQVGRRVDESQPLCDARLLDGSRVNVAIAPIAVDGPLVSIRKFSKKPFTLDKLVEFGAVPDVVAQFLWAACKARVTILISGGTGSGKTTLLNALSQSISEKERLITIEDAAELQLQQPHVARMETRPPNIEGKGEIRQRGLVKNALRMRPDRVILGEVRGEEAFDMLQAMNTGHEGSMATLHANTPRDAITRLEQMVAMGDMKITPEAVAGQIASAIGLIVQAVRLSDGQRKITSVAEVTGMEGAVIQMQEIFNYTRTGTGPKHEVIGEFRATGIRPRCLEEITTRDIPLPEGIFEPAVLPVGPQSDQTIKERVG
ncbi:CpaF family protein [Litorimonas sp. RW-G-Af-16]|uniref:CpaF family protein n=1 Tax=Litorimonas sp. RW-G-Af-16 TaxID=3241168 RepID=UPI00390C4AB3